MSPGTVLFILFAVGIVITLVAACGKSGRSTVTHRLQYRPAPVDNPLKGFIPYQAETGSLFPCSMVWAYFPLSELMNGPDSFTFDGELETSLNQAATNGNHLVFRVYLDYPGKETGVPKFLLDAGLKMTKYEEHGGGQSPDYSDERLIAALEKFIAALGRRYDGDPRIGFITIGLLGFWGEWHTYPHEDWFPGEAVQNRVLAAFTNAFTKTRLLMRLPHANGKTLPIGFHDDSFTHDTLPTIDWHFLSILQRANALDRWKTQPIGGELLPEYQSNIWVRPLPAGIPIEDFETCVRETHCSWLLNNRVFWEQRPDAERERALEGARSLGYELHVSEAAFTTGGDGTVEVSIQVENRGVAPFYYDWELQLRLQMTGVDDIVLSVNRNAHSPFPLREPGRPLTPSLSPDGGEGAAASKPAKRVRLVGDTRNSDWRLTDILPGQTVHWSHVVPGSALGAGTYQVALRVVNPLPNGKPLRFANKEQQEDGWLDLGELVIR